MSDDKPEFDSDPFGDEPTKPKTYFDDVPTGKSINETPWPRATPNSELPDDAGIGTAAIDAATQIRRQRRREALRDRQVAERAALLAAHDAELRDAGIEKVEPVTEPIKSFAPVNININLNELMQYFGMEYDEDGPTGNPTRDIRQQVLDMVADRLVKQVMGGDAAFKERLSDSINEALGDIIVDMLTHQFQPTDWSGQPKGDPTTLTEIIGAQAKQFLAEAMSEPGRYDDRSNNHKGKLKKFVNEEVGRQFDGDLKIAAAEAKATVIKAVTDKGAEFLGQAFADAATKVQAATTVSKTIGTS